jgi:hypothetical protein
MSVNFQVLESVRLTGRIVDDALEITTKRDEFEIVDALDIESDTLPVRLQCYDFTDTAGRVWQFVPTGGWQRRAGTDHAWLDLSSYKDGDAYNALCITVQTKTTAAAAERPKQIYIKLKPIIDGPDRS